MTVHHLPKPIPDGDPNHQSRNFLVPGKSALPSLPFTPRSAVSLWGGTHGTNRCRARFFAEWPQPPLPEGGARSCDTNSECWSTTPGASRDSESLRVAEDARFLTRTCQEHKPGPGELWPCSQPRPSSQFLILPPHPTCIYPTPSFPSCHYSLLLGGLAGSSYKASFDVCAPLGCISVLPSVSATACLSHCSEPSTPRRPAP